jgi:hypothetical protein
VTNTVGKGASPARPFSAQHVGYVLREMSHLDDTGLDAELEKYRACVKMLCDELGLSVFMSEMTQFQAVVPETARREMHSSMNEFSCCPSFHAAVFAKSRHKVMEKLQVFDMSAVPTEKALLSALHESANSDILSAYSLLDDMLWPRHYMSGEKSVKQFELYVYMVLEQVFTSGCYWVVAYEGATQHAEGRSTYDFKVLDGKSPEFCCRPEFDLRLQAEGMPKFRIVEVEQDKKEG